MPLSNREQDQLVRLLAKSTNDPKITNIGTLAREHLAKAVEVIAEMSQRSLVPELRLKAAQSIVELSKLNAPDDDFVGDTEALKALSDLPQGEQRTAALRMFADGQIGRKDLDTVLKILDSGQALQVMMLTQQNKYLEALLDKRIEREAKLIEARVNGEDPESRNHLFPNGLSVPPVPRAPVAN